MLWIAFNLITFVDITQHSWQIPHCQSGCELLSIWLLLWISHSVFFIYSLFKAVVNCFQFDYFCGYHTAVIGSKPMCTLLWIAFNLITFVDITQLVKQWHHMILWLWIAFNLITFVDITQLLEGQGTIALGCELLSIWLLLWISHS